MLRTLAISSFVFAGAVSVASADVFRWVDDHGGVHYSDQWVPGSEVIKSTKPHPANTVASAAPSSAKVAADAQKSADAAAKEQQNASQAMKQDKAKVREQQCKDAKVAYDKAIEARRIYKSPDDKGKENWEEREYLSDEEADAYRVKARQRMDDFCGKPAK